MAYAIVGVVKTNELRGTNLVPVKEYQVLSLPSQTYFEFRRDASQGGYTNPGPAATQLSDRIEAVLALPSVTDVVWSQHPTPAGTLKDWMTTYYSAQGGAIQGSVESDLAHFGPNYTGAQISGEVSEGSQILATDAYDSPGSPGPGV